MGKYFSVLIFDTTTVSGTTVIVPQTNTILTGGARLYLIDAPNTTYTLSHLGKGVWGAGSIPDGVYKLQTNAGSWVDNIYYSDASGKWIGDESFDASIIGSGTLALARIPTITNAKLDTGIDAVKISAGNVTNTEFDFLNGVTSAIQTQFANLDSAVVHKAGSETITGAKLMQANLVIDTTLGVLSQSVYQAPTDNKWYAPKKYVDDAINTYLLGLTIPLAQQSDRELRVIYGGSVESNRVFLTIDLAIAHAVAQTPALAEQYYINIYKNGLETGYGANAVITSFPDYVHLSGQNENTIVFPADSTFTCGALGRTTIKDLRMEWGAGATATPAFVNYIFENCVFDINDNAINFNSCIFINCKLVATSGTVAITNCNGSPIVSDVLPTITGYAPRIYITGEYNQRSENRKGANVASAQPITLGNYGNYFEITGTTNIENITVTGWKSGDIIRLRFAGILNMVHQGATTSGKLWNQSGANITTATNTTLVYVLDGSTWYQI